MHLALVPHELFLEHSLMSRQPPVGVRALKPVGQLQL